MVKKILLGLLFTVFPCAPAAADDTPWWPHFLGPRRDGTSPEKNINTDWKQTPPKVLWKIPLGEGFSSFAVVGERAYTMTKRGDKLIVLCLDAKTGKEVWSHDVAPNYIDKQKQGAGPRATPTYHDGKLYCLMPMGEFVCLAAANGERLWTANVFNDTGAKNRVGEQFYWGVALSPLIEGDLVIVQPGGDKDNSVAAFYKNTGKLAWAAGSDPMCYGSPQAITVAGQRQLIVPTASSVLGIEPTTGKILWRYVIGDKAYTICSTPLWFDNQLWFSAAYNAGCGVLDISNQGGTWTVKEKWKNKNGLLTLYSNAMIVDGHAYGCHGDLSAWMLKCVDLKTGQVKWDERLDQRQWLLAVDGHMLCWGEKGSLKLLKMDPKGNVQKGEMPKLLVPKAWAAPVLANGRLYLRDQANALCIDLRKP
ncbi:MAG TPA: PQQ-binding-like beta-propeller repeat protein [Gemmataceae bacterium]|nr:PQQ-binding-like beta-propeller repeat protein [Gemmataceae bacterium]